MPKPAVRPHTITDYMECGTCRTRVIYPVDAHGRKLPPVNWAPDPTGEMAVEHTATGTWLGSWPRPGEDVTFPRKRFRLHKCHVAAALPGTGAPPERNY